ncbi:hypothetical protein HAX54_043215 [Datura stramonium]|uniref:Uncharacterized protein n=1 Tax=Datura stramonium TaxID=4076 RepID=A0ABS8SMZ5_DATST|nr:hypothetical protein [Datura stramonium]
MKKSQLHLLRSRSKRRYRHTTEMMFRAVLNLKTHQSSKWLSQFRSQTTQRFRWSHSECGYWNLACILLSFLNQFFWFRREPLSISSISAQIAVVPLGHLMAMAIPNRVFFKGRKFEFTLNPGPFNVKEHVLITIFANSGAGNPYAIHIVSAVKVFYKRTLTFWVSLIVVLIDAGFGLWMGRDFSEVFGGARCYVVAPQSCASFSFQVRPNPL